MLTEFDIHNKLKSCVKFYIWWCLRFVSRFNPLAKRSLCFLQKSLCMETFVNNKPTGFLRVSWRCDGESLPVQTTLLRLATETFKTWLAALLLCMFFLHYFLTLALKKGIIIVLAIKNSELCKVLHWMVFENGFNIENLVTMSLLFFGARRSGGESLPVPTTLLPLATRCLATFQNLHCCCVCFSCTISLPLHFKKG